MVKIWLKCVQKKAPDGFCIGMVKKIKNKIKTTVEKVSICHFGLVVLVYNNNDCQIVKIKSVFGQIILSFKHNHRLPAREANQSCYYSVFFTIPIQIRNLGL
mgnify:CR=1 FL=1